MNTLTALSLITGASAFIPIEVGLGTQKTTYANSCPANSILSSGLCQLSAPTREKHYNSAQKDTNFPWKFKSECYSNQNLTEPVCAFSHQDFASDRGIIIFTTSTRANKMLQKPAFAERNALDGINNHDNPPFELREMPGKGRGLIANRTLHRGDQIFASTALVLTDPDAHLLDDKVRLALYHNGVKTLPAGSQALFWELLGHFSGDPIDDRINTNAFEVAINDDVINAVFPEIAMMNHDCRPNSAYFWDEETLSHHVHATQTIYPGQEITVTYLNNEMSRKRRMSLLERNWGFKCTCSACSAHSALAKESDARLKQIADLSVILDDWSHESQATPAMAEALISLYEQERLFGNLGEAYLQAAEAYSAVGDKWGAIKYARLSIEYKYLDTGFRDNKIQEIKFMAKDPEMSWSWKRRLGHENAGTRGIIRLFPRIDDVELAPDAHLILVRL